MKNWFTKFSFQMENIFFLRVIHQALTSMIPFIMAGAMSYAFLNLPVKAYQDFLALPQFAWFSQILNDVYYGTYDFFSPVFVIAIALSYTINRNIRAYRIPFFVLTAFVGYGTALNIGSAHFSIDALGIKGCFQAMVVAFITCHLFYLFQKLPAFNKGKHSSGMEIVCAEAIHMIIPALLICILWASLNELLRIIWNVNNLHELISTTIQTVFHNLGTDFLSALLYTFMLHFLWLLGFHGSWLLETAADTNFAAVGPDIIFSKDMFDVFVVMGGCGTTICVLAAILLFTRIKRLRKIAATALFPALFNINEIVNFGIPIVLNPILGIPFLLVPLEALIISYSAIAIGICPPVVNEIAWSTPIFFSGYLATGSLRGTLLQLFIVVIGTATYLPFLRINESLHEANLKEQLKAMIAEMQDLEAAGMPVDFLSRTDDKGLLAQMLLRDLKSAIKNKELFLLYQPQMDYKGHCFGAEAVIRWNHPIFGSIYPPLLVYIAKAGNILLDFDMQLFDMACAAIQDISKDFSGSFKISVNLTAKSLNWDGLEDCIQDTLTRYQVPPEKLWMEITEQDILSNSQNTLDKLSRIKAMGHSLLIDDFGMGHTSLIYLQSGHFDVVKLDGSLTKSILTNEINQKIVSSIVDLSKKLNIHVIAEFVETRQEMEKLHEIGCDWYQGYLFSPAIPLEQFMVYLKEHQ